MLEFIKDDDISYYDELTKLFCEAINAGGEGMDVDLNLNARECLKAVICDEMYSFFPKKAGYRQLLKQYSSDQFANLVLSTIKNIDYELFFKCVKEVDNKYYINREDFSIIIDFYVKKGLNNMIKQNPKFIDLTEEEIKKMKQALATAEFLSPSDKLKQAILSGEQTNLSVSFNEMTASSNVGKFRDEQEDSYYIGVHPKNPNFKIMVVADGMGGYNDGRIASNIAVRDLMLWFENISEEEYCLEENESLKKQLNEKIENIQNHICDRVLNGGTTLCFAIIKKDSILIGNIGDSQGYIIEDNKPVCITEPQNRPNILGIPKELTRFHIENNSIYSFLGQTANGSVSHPIDFYEVKINPGYQYRVILCSDGVSDCVAEKDILDTALNSNDNVSQTLVNLAIANTSYLKDEQLSAEAKKYQEANKKMFYDIIPPGKDNTTAVSTVIRR